MYGCAPGSSRGPGFHCLTERPITPSWKEPEPLLIAKRGQKCLQEVRNAARHLRVFPVPTVLSHSCEDEIAGIRIPWMRPDPPCLCPAEEIVWRKSLHRRLVRLTMRVRRGLRGTALASFSKGRDARDRRLHALVRHPSRWRSAADSVHAIHRECPQARRVRLRRGSTPPT